MEKGVAMAKNIIWSGKHDLISRKALALKSIVVDGRRMIPYMDLIEATGVDYAEAVMCGECRNYVEGHCCRSLGGGSYEPFPMNPNDFCSYGERRYDE